jgi:phosphatidate cytidylyltransferase
VKKLIQRLLVFIIGLPSAIFIVAGLPQKHHLTANIIVIVLSSLGAGEFAGMLRKEGYRISPGESVILGCLAPLGATLTVSFGVGGDLFFAAVPVLGIFWVLIRRAFAGEKTLMENSKYLTAGLSVLLYPGLLLSWLVMMGLLPGADRIMAVFLLMVIVNDSAAWAAGMLFGKGNRGIIPASPNKSAAGFIGGFAASVLVGAGAVIYFSPVFNSPALPSPWAGLILGFFTATAASLGDLAESAMKRGAGIKDSGSSIPGRGGVLDSIDSIALAAPVYYFCYRLLFM